MTCRAAITQNPILTARWLAIVEPTLPLSHVPDFRTYDDETGAARCKRCHRWVTSRLWAAQVCPGPAVKA